MNLDIHRNMITLLYRETATRVDLDAVESLCRLFNCEVGELFELVDIPESKKAPESKKKK